MNIQVTQEHIKQGVRRDCHYCPVALALRETLTEANYTGVFSTGINVDGVMHPTIESVKDFMDAFDGGLPVEPFSFELGE